MSPRLHFSLALSCSNLPVHSHVRVQRNHRWATIAFTLALCCLLVMGLQPVWAQEVTATITGVSRIAGRTAPRPGPALGRQRIVHTLVRETGGRPEGDVARTDQAVHVEARVGVVPRGGAAQPPKCTA